MTSYMLRTEGCDVTIKADTVEEARAEAENVLRDGWDDDSAKTWWSKGYLFWTDEDGEEQEERICVRIDPSEPDCSRNDGYNDGHDWQSPHAIVGGLRENPGVWGHGGGVVIVECCMHCGCQRTTDTWAQDPETGEQGLEAVSYEAGKYEQRTVDQ